ncbi:DUF3299 domain-containing protein [Opitutus sp. GAS368]|uniref:DUF3299 domain-containing protein n=1 Tax=Opitutus sp. GAS368 TaxID=1882749 RepID=UPI0008796AB4|nr:DUF3299 domain-containing protein [Opitutus sp. GAS368]SDS32664.1 Protein of unknown function [Opitutus sp. GAS368]
MKTPLVHKIRRGLLLAGTAAFAAVASAQSSYYQRFQQGGGCPFCNPGGQQNYDLPPDNPPPPEPAKAESAPATPAAAVPTPPAAVAAVTTPRAKPGLTKEQAMAMAAQIAAATPDQPLKREPDGSWNVNFGQLASYKLEAPPAGTVARPGSVERIPEPLRKLDGQKVRVSGFMLPMKVEGGLATEFLIVRNPLVCCYGMMPAPNEWVCVKAPGKGVPMQMDTPLQFSGTLHVGEIYENDFFVGVYRLDADKVSIN